MNETSTGLYSPASGDVSVSSLGSEMLRVTNSYSDFINGKVGIATSNPQSSLHIYGGEAQVSSSRSPCSTNLAGAIRYVVGTLQYCDGNQWDTLNSNVTAGTSIPAAGLPGDVQFNGSVDLAANANFYWNNSLLRLGIGTNAPAATLDVWGGIDISGQNGVSFPPDYTPDASIAIGSGALGGQITAGTAATQGNVAIGYQALGSASMTTAAINNTAVGYQALQHDTTGKTNIAIGYDALQTNTTGNNNIAIGVSSEISMTGGGQNVAIGGNSLFSPGRQQ